MSTYSALHIQVYRANGQIWYDQVEEPGFTLDDDEIRRMAEGIKAKHPECGRIVIATAVGKVRFDSAKLL
jgi:hypothetical protein